MLCPKWVSTPSQPIAIEDLLDYLLAALDLPDGSGDVFEIGGPDQVSYREIMREYARQRGLKRWMISVPFLSPRLSSLWLGLVTPVYARVGRKLVDGLRNPTLVTNSRASEAFAIRPRGVCEAIARALANEDHELTATRWSDALSASGRLKRWGGIRFGTRLVDSREVEVGVPVEVAFAPIQRIGGSTGLVLRRTGYGDFAAGSICSSGGVRNATRSARSGGTRNGDTVDCWRVDRSNPIAGCDWLPR